MPFALIELAVETQTQLEQLGTKAKFWFHDEQRNRFLFKQGRPGTGENWAEKVCCEVADLLGLPHAEYELAVWQGRKGVVTPSFVPDEHRLVLGNELLAKIVDGYDQSKRFKERGYTLRSSMIIASAIGKGFPLGWTPPTECTSVDGLFTGYLLLDALVSNQDRHHENWGIVVSSHSGVTFTPTFDHASSLGRNELDATRHRILTTNDKNQQIPAYVGRAKSAFYSTPASTKKLTTLEALSEAAKIAPVSAAFWKARLAAIDQAQFGTILAEIPDTEISQCAREFARCILVENTRRILDLSN